MEDRVEILNRDVALCKGAFDLIVANLISGVFIQLHKHLISLMKPGGHLIASGLTENDARDVEKIFCNGDVTLHNTQIEREWVCYTFRKA